MTRGVVLVLAAAGAAAIVALALDPQLALGKTSDIGKNVGDEVRSWATTLLLGVAALVSIPVLARRDVNGGLVLALLVLIVGGFVFAQGEVKNIINSLWQAIGS
jgi:cobalamin synthase